MINFGLDKLTNKRLQNHEKFIAPNGLRLNFGGDFRLVSLSPVEKLKIAFFVKPLLKPRLNLNRCYKLAANKSVSI